VWVKLAIRRMYLTGNYVIEDLRFENEAKAVREAGGTIVHLSGREHAMTEATVQHASEKGIAFGRGDMAYNNTGPIEDLYRFLNELVYHVGQ